MLFASIPYEGRAMSGKISMKSKRVLLTCTIAAITVSMGATANEIYKWTDADGTVHYEDRPTGAATEVRLEMTYRSTDRSAVQKRIKSRVDAQTARDEARSAAEIAEQEAAENAAAEQQRKERCERSRARLETYTQARRVYRTDENGERVYLDETQRQEARQKAEEQIAEFCS
jgi:recombination DNA repair RAD52 pathway protein